MAVDARCRIVGLFCYILFLHSLAIIFFTRGFLLTRTELPEFSTCSDVAKSGCFGKYTALSDTASSVNLTEKIDKIVEGEAFFSQDDGIRKAVEGGREENIETNRQSDDKPSSECWTKPAIKRVIIIVIDALRFDFVAPSSHFPGESQPWMDKLRVLQKLYKEENGSARIFKFVADPPTTTLQRLKGLTTGGLPTFVDIGDSFGAPAIVEDNLIYQLVQSGKKVRMMGDDTWMKLFPSHFSVAHPFDSFNVKDLHTVDDGVIREIFPALLEPDWNVLIAHFLGVDHVGHIFGVESPLMVEKLEQYDRVIEDIVTVLKNQSGPGGSHEDTMLLVLGDHGQTLHGDHGGGTSEEVDTALFALSMRESPGRLPLDLQSSTCTINTESNRDQSPCITTFPQLDFASTMAALLGVPFPFGSVGRVNTELYALAASTWPFKSEDHPPEDPIRMWMERYSLVLCMNSWQVKRYLDTYSTSSIRGFPTSDLAYVQSLYEKALVNIHSLYMDHIQMGTNDSVSDRSKFKEISDETTINLLDSIQDNMGYLLAAANLARTQWTQFEDEWMAIGLFLLIISMVVQGVALKRALSLSVGSRSSEDKNSEIQSNLQELFPVKRMVMACGVVAAIAGVILGFYTTTGWVESSLFATVIAGGQVYTTLAAVALVSIIAYVFPARGPRVVQSDQNIYAKGQTVCSSYREACIPNAKLSMAIVFVGLHACGLLSNSYILSEGQVVCFLLATSGILYLRRAIQSCCKVPQAILLLLLNVGMASVGLVQIFKDPATVASPSLKDEHSSASNSPQLSITDSCIALITTVLPLSSLVWLITRRARKLFTFRSLYWAIALTIPFSYFLLIIHWFTMDIASCLLLEIPQSFMEFSRLFCPQLVYMASLMLVIFTIIKIALSTRVSVLTSCRHHIVEGIVAVVAGLSGTILLLLGRKGPMVVLLAALEIWCLLDLQALDFSNDNATETGKVYF
ncbi:uncharacterized protein [Physcomitrium patens]|uniref:uncharacterized protein isoform X2 n=1 Tax=Physcomitrium patens TaxID=3218 RepID=UPI000D1510D2|nr:GPI ethanolamine phosphate transferase 3-like isoform X2 [Physcomitrium patens]|eukprot:XP_024356410.1 GPI ethanolamine phosphate transferase 3-like isoform X2 [Physcomitrella patens]